MNAAKLFLGTPSKATLTHILSAHASIRRTWRDLHDNVAALSVSLDRMGVRSDDRLLIVANSRVEVIECILTAMHIGCVAVPVSPSAGRQTLLSIARNMAPTCCVFESQLDPEVLSLLRETHCRMVGLHESSDDAEHFLYSDLVKPVGQNLTFSDFNDSTAALIIHSSGSSGNPKVVVMSHGAIVRYFEFHNLVWCQYADASDSLTATSAMVSGLPLNHLAGISLCLQGLLNGRDSYVMGYFMPRVYLELIESTRCACMLLVPSIYRALLKEPYLKLMDRSAIRCCILGGEPCSLQLIHQIEAAFGVPAVTAYSMTECLSGIGHGRRELFAKDVTPGSCGRALFGESVLRDACGVLNEDFGELWVRNATVHACYLDPLMNQQRIQDGWFRTGDLFSRNAAGDYFHRGRVDDMFICNGKNVYPSEMELLLMSLSGIEAVCAAPVNSRHNGVVPGVLVVTSNALTRLQVQEHFRNNGPRHTIPQVVSFVEQMPLIGPGKIDRRVAADLLQTQYDADVLSPAAHAN